MIEGLKTRKARGEVEIWLKALALREEVATASCLPRGMSSEYHHHHQFHQSSITTFTKKNQVVGTGLQPSVVNVNTRSGRAASIGVPDLLNNVLSRSVV